MSGAVCMIVNIFTAVHRVLPEGKWGGSSADLFMYVNVDIGLDGATLYEKVIHLNTGGFWQ